MTVRHTKRPPALRALMALILFQGVSAVPSGLILVIDPTGGIMHMPIEMLQGTPFANFLIPGLILGIVLGVAPLIVFAGLLTLPKWSWAERLNPFRGEHWTMAASAAAGVAVMIWITVQVLMIGLGAFLQGFYFCVGLAIVALAVSRPVRDHLRG